MDNSDRQPDETRCLVRFSNKRTTHHPTDQHRRALDFVGRTREWTIVARFHGGWCVVQSYWKTFSRGCLALDVAAGLKGSAAEQAF